MKSSSAIRRLAHTGGLLRILTLIAAAMLSFGSSRAFAQASIVSPAPGQSLPVPNFTLRWNFVRQIESFIYLGSQQGANDYYGNSMGMATSVNFTWQNAPASVWIRLWSKMPIYFGVAGGTVAYYQWQARDYFYRISQAAAYNWKLPLPGGYSYVCTAPANDPGHHDGANFYSLDFARGGNRAYPYADVPVYALHSGKVLEVFTGPLDYKKYVVYNGLALYGLPPNGYFVRLDADGDGDPKTGLVTLYLHLKYPPTLRKGDNVTAGQQLGIMGTTGASTGEHLHVQFKFNNSSASPNPELDKIRIENFAITDFVRRGVYNSTR